MFVQSYCWEGAILTRLEQAIRSKDRPLFGAAVQSYNPAFVEIISRLGYDVVWIEMEHCLITFAEAADMCRIASGTGLLSMIRIPDSRRENALKAAECAPDIIDLPMANSPEVLRDLVEHARFAPIGHRGFFGSSRAAGYGLDSDVASIHKRVNEELCLMGQIETVEAVERAEELCGVTGIDGIFIGPGDLSVSMGVPGQVDHPVVLDSIHRIIEVARSNGKIVTLAGGRGSFADMAARGVQLFFIGGEVSFMHQSARSYLDSALDEIGTGGGGKPSTG